MVLSFLPYPSTSGKLRDSFMSTPLVADWESQGEDRQHLDQREPESQTQEVRQPVAGQNLAGEPKKGPSLF